MTLEDNGKNERLVAGLMVMLALVGCLAESLFYNHPIIARLGLSEKLSVLNPIYSSYHYWLTNGIYWRAALMVTLTLLVWMHHANHKPDEKIQPYLIYTVLGVAAILSCHLLLRHNLNTPLYIGGNTLFYGGLLTFLTGITGIKRVSQFGSKVIHDNKLKGQNTKLIETERSINWKTADGYVNITNPFRGICIVGGPGAGKSYTLIEPIIDQVMRKGFTGMVYDFKYPTLGRYTYNMFLKHNKVKFYFDKEEKKQKPERQFYCISFKDIRYSHRCNPIHPKIMDSKVKSDEVAMTVMLNLEKDWIKKRDFFASSAIAYFSSIIWFMRKYAVRKQEENIALTLSLLEAGKGEKNPNEHRDYMDFCSLPHAIKLGLSDAEKVLTILSQDPECMAGAIPLLDAFEKGAMEQLAGQISSLQLPIGKLTIKEMTYIMTGNDFTLDLNNPAEPKVVIIGNDDMLKKVFAPALSLYCSVIAATINQKGREPSAFIVDEFPTVFIPGIDNLPNTGRSNKVCFCIAMQDYGQLDRDYGKEEARVLKAGCGNIFIGEVSDENTAKVASDLMGKEFTTNKSITISKSDTTQSVSEQLNSIIPINAIMQLETGEFVGKVAEVEVDRKGQVNSKLFASRFMVDKTGDPDHDIPKIFDVYENLPYGVDPENLPQADPITHRTQEDILIDMLLDENVKRIDREVEEMIFEEFELAKIMTTMKRADEYRDVYLYVHKNQLFKFIFHDVNTRLKTNLRQAEDESLAAKRNSGQDGQKREPEALEDKLKRVTNEYIVSALENYFTLNPQFTRTTK